MSFDLEFVVPPGRDAPSHATVLQHFVGRRHFQVNEDQALYENEKTRVHFSFDRAHEEDIADDEAEGREPSIWSFNMNYWRPSFFALEADRELQAFTRELGFLVRDLQDDDEARPYDGPRFIESWTGNNEAAAAALRRTHDLGDPPFLVSRSELLDGWEWMYGVDALQEQVGESMFVPSLLYLRRDGVVHRAVIWTQGIPMAWPKCDLVLLGRDVDDGESVWRTVPRSRLDEVGVPLATDPRVPGGFVATWEDEAPAPVTQLFTEGEWDPQPDPEGAFFGGTFEEELWHG